MGAAEGRLQAPGRTGSEMGEGDPQVQWPTPTGSMDVVLPLMPDAPEGM